MPWRGKRIPWTNIIAADMINDAAATVPVISLHIAFRTAQRL